MCFAYTNLAASIPFTPDYEHAVNLLQFFFRSFFLLNINYSFFVFRERVL